MRIATKVSALGVQRGTTLDGRPLPRGRRRPDAFEQRPCAARAPRSRRRDQPRHRSRDRRRVALRLAAHVPRLEALVLHLRVAAALRTRRRPRAVRQVHGAPAGEGCGARSSATRSAAAGVAVDGGVTVLPTPLARVPRREDALAAAPRHRPLHGPEQRQLHCRGAAEAARRRRRGTRHVRGRSTGRRRGARRRAESRQPASGSSTARASREYDRLTVGALVGILQAFASDSALESELRAARCRLRASAARCATGCVRRRSSGTSLRRRARRRSRRRSPAT